MPTLVATLAATGFEAQPREIEAERKRLRSPDSMPRSEYDARAADLNRRIRDFNLTAPPGLEKLPFVPRR